MTEVRLRHEDDGKAKTLGDVPFSDVDSVIPRIKEWGLYADEFIDVDGLCGQFRYDESGAYFEVAFS